MLNNTYELVVLCWEETNLYGYKDKEVVLRRCESMPDAVDELAYWLDCEHETFDDNSDVKFFSISDHHKGWFMKDKNTRYGCGARAFIRTAYS